jgi:hypothetical protein
MTALPISGGGSSFVFREESADMTPEPPKDQSAKKEGQHFCRP